MRPRQPVSADTGDAVGTASNREAAPNGDPAPNLPARFTRGSVAGVVVCDLRKLLDERGWLSELYRDDEAPEGFRPAMCYISTTHAGGHRGPHEHVEQADFFCFVGPSNFKLRLWDTRRGSETYGRVMTVFAGEDAPKSVLVPKGVVHAYRNIGDRTGLVLNFPDRLYMGEGRRDPVDEIRHEENPSSPFRLDD